MHINPTELTSLEKQIAQMLLMCDQASQARIEAAVLHARVSGSKQISVPDQETAASSKACGVFQSLVLINVIHEDDVDLNSMGPAEIVQEILTGDATGHTQVVGTVALTRDAAIEACEDVGSDPSFFFSLSAEAEEEDAEGDGSRGDVGG